MTTRADVKHELDEMKKIGINVPDGAYIALQENMTDEELNCMTSTEASDLCVNLGGLYK